MLASLIASLAWLQMPMGFKTGIPSSTTVPNLEVLDLTIEPGTTPRGVAQAIADAAAKAAEDAAANGQ